MGSFSARIAGAVECPLRDDRRAGPLDGVQAIAAEGIHTCALVGGAVQCWGDNTYGDLGNGSTTSSKVPVTVSAWAP